MAAKHERCFIRDSRVGINSDLVIPWNLLPKNPLDGCLAFELMELQEEEHENWTNLDQTKNRP